jgi:hypothetical protein
MNETAFKRARFWTNAIGIAFDDSIDYQKNELETNAKIARHLWYASFGTL